MTPGVTEKGKATVVMTDCVGMSMDMKRSSAGQNPNGQNPSGQNKPKQHNSVGCIKQLCMVIVCKYT